VPIQPYVSAAAFRAEPTLLDLNGLRFGSANPAEQTAELTNILLRASAWADNQCNQPLGAHMWTQRCRARVDRAGNLRFHADHRPVISVTSIGYGMTPTALTTVDGAGAWVESEANVVMPLGGANVAWSGSLQFGLPLSGEVFVQAVMVAGYVATTLGADSLAATSTITVADPTGLMPGGQYRIWEPGVEETVTVSPAWIPPLVTIPAAATTVALATPTRFAHTAGSDLSGLPAEVRTAVSQYAAALLTHPETAGQDEFPNSTMGSDTRRNDPRNGSGLIADAARTLSSYGAVR
jgi:hypothetical protein